ncbi:kinase-like protein [Auricularia subglabra TFB-10046 SS5]|nr:kinase-like protein [Auricularia subglabra TFB-10046 SS5]
MCHFGIQQIGLVSPLMKNGNMVEFLRKKPSANRLKLMTEVAEGLEYLHVSARIVHGDLKGENVLISGEDTAMLCDFGLCTSVEYGGDATSTNIRTRYTLCYAAPELLMDSATSPSSRGVVRRSKTTYSDVYAYGMLVYQVRAWATIPVTGSAHVPGGIHWETTMGQ